jgi:hypothetical protein
VTISSSWRISSNDFFTVGSCVEKIEIYEVGYCVAISRLVGVGFCVTIPIYLEIWCLVFL